MVGAAILSVAVLAGAAVFAGMFPGSPALADPSAVASTPAGAPPSGTVLDPSGPASPSALSPSASLPSGFVPIDLFAVQPVPLLNPTDAPGDSIFRFDPGRRMPDQSPAWLMLKAAGRIVLSGGKIGLLDEDVDPLVGPGTGRNVPAARTLDLTWSRWIVEPPAWGLDVKGNSYRDLSYWNLCGPGAVSVTLYYWQKLTGHPNVMGAAGYYLDPYESAGADWPSRGPSLPTSGGKRLGTYWSGSDTVSGFTAHGRGFLMYMAMATKPASWTSRGIDIFVDGLGRARYPTLGAPPDYMTAGLNWEASGRHADGWVETYYTIVPRWDPFIARDLQVAVMLDVGRDGVPIVASADTYYLPNWQNGSRTPHTRHAIAIVGYDNSAKPPTYTYLDTCGRGCNSRAGNRPGQIHVIAQDRLVKAVTANYGMGFIW